MLYNLAVQPTVCFGLPQSFEHSKQYISIKKETAFWSSLSIGGRLL
jgi:hypothetical protein